MASVLTFFPPCVVMKYCTFSFHHRMHVLIIAPTLNQGLFFQRGLHHQNLSTQLMIAQRFDPNPLTLAQFDSVLVIHAPPQAQGFHIIHRLHHAGFTLPILFISSSAADRFPAEESGVYRFFGPPLSLHTIGTTLRDLVLLQVTESLQSVVSVGDIELSRSAREVSKGRSRIALRTKEFALLELLMLNAGHVVPRQTILDAVWDRNVDFATNTVDVHVHRLRQKIDRRFKTRVLETIHGVGYRFNTNSS